MVGLWGGPYLTHIYGYSLTERGNMLLVAGGGAGDRRAALGADRSLFGSYKIR